MPRKLGPASSLAHLKKEAKRWLKKLRDGDPEARARLEAAYPAASSAPAGSPAPPVPRASEEPVLRDVQHALACEYGFESWVALRAALAGRAAGAATGDDDVTGWPVRTNEEYERLAEDIVRAFNERDEAALGRLNEQYRREFTLEDLGAEIWRRVYSYRQRAFGGKERTPVELAETQLLVAQDAGFQSWEALLAAGAKGAARVPAYDLDTPGTIAPRRQLSDAEWDELIEAARQHDVHDFVTHGLMTDAVLARVAKLDRVTRLELSGSRGVGDDGLMHLAGMPQLEELVLTGVKISDRGLRVLRKLPALRKLEMTWQQGISDEGAAHLRHCERLEILDLMGSNTGDGAIAALAGKAKLRHLSTGRLVTDDGLRLLHDLPLMKEWQGGDVLRDPNDALEQRAAQLLIDGPFTNDGLAGLAGLAGVAKLDLFWHCTGITSDGLAHLAGLPHLAALGCDGELSDDTGLRHIAAIPSLRFLRAQEAPASDAGFEALGGARHLEGLWGRVCPNFGSRGFVALSRLPKLRQLGIGCKNVDDAALATLPDFPALRELTPIGFTDDGFRHIGRCEKLERLTCMYCREAGDAGTEHIGGLNLKYYYAGLTQITDRSLEILGRMDSLEQVDLYECKRVTDAGLAHLAKLPNLREVNLDALPGVTFEGTRVFPDHVRVRYAT